MCVRCASMKFLLQLEGHSCSHAAFVFLVAVIGNHSTNLFMVNTYLAFKCQAALNRLCEAFLANIYRQSPIFSLVTKNTF